MQKKFRTIKRFSAPAGYFRIALLAGVAFLLTGFAPSGIVQGGPSAGAADRPFQVVDFKNGEIRKGKYAFIYQNSMDPEVQSLRKTGNLDAVVAGAGTEFEMIRRLTAWAAKQGISNKGKEGPDVRRNFTRHGTSCGGYSTLLADALLSFGIPSRFLGIRSGPLVDPATGKTNKYAHAVNDVWSNDYQKWVYMDAYFDTYFTDTNGVPLGPFELQAAVLTGQTGGVRRAICGGYPADAVPRVRDNPYYRDTWAPTMLDRLLGFRHIDLLAANNIHDPGWQASEKGPHGEKLGAMRLYYWPDVPGFQPFWYDYQHHEITHDIRDVTWNLYDVAISGLQTNTSVTGRQAPLTLTTFAPFLECFLVRVDGGPWQDVKATRSEGHDAEMDYVWSLHDGQNTLEVRVRNQQGRLGVVRLVRLSDEPASQSRRPAGAS